MAILRRLRGIVGMAGTWAVALSVVSTALLLGGLAAGVIPGSIFGAREIVEVAARNFAFGALAGAVFGLVVTNTERRKTLSSLSMRRVAMWGFLAGASVFAAFAVAVNSSFLLPAALIVGGAAAFGGMGAAIGAATLRIARQAPSLSIEGGSGDATNLLPRP